MYFGRSNLVVFLLLCLVIGGGVAVGIAIGKRFAHREDAEREPVGVVQGTLLGLVGLLLAFGLSMAVGRYDNRRAAVVDEANAIGTTHLRAQMLPEPARGESLALLVEYADAAVSLADQVPDSDEFDATVDEIASLQRSLWRAAGDAVAADPTGTAPRLYVETLNDMIDEHTVRVASLRNRVPTPVMVLEVAGSAVAIGVLALYLTMIGRRVTPSLLSAAFVIVILFVTFDLDRPQRGLITVPFGPLVDVRASMDEPPAVAPAP